MIVVYTVLFQSRYLDYYTVKKYSGSTFRKPFLLGSSNMDQIRTYDDCYFIGVF